MKLAERIVLLPRLEVQIRVPGQGHHAQRKVVKAMLQYFVLTHLTERGAQKCFVYSDNISRWLFQKVLSKQSFEIALFVKPFMFLISMRYITYSVLILSVLSCGQSTRNAQEIVLDPFISNVKEISISEIASQIDYIQLETTPESFISYIYKIQTKDDKIFILDIRNPSILIFDMSGKFIRRIGRVGNGPGEYIEPHDFALSDSVVLIWDPMQWKTILYDSLGRLITEKRLKNCPVRVAFYKGMPACEYNFPDFSRNNGFRISIYDRGLNLVTNILKSNYSDEVLAGIYGSHSRSFFANVNDTLTFWESREDIVYKIVDEYKVVEKYRLRYKNQAKLEDGVLNLKKGSNEMDTMRETENYIFLTGIYRDEYCRLLYSKKTGTGFNVGEGFKNNEGPDFFPEGVTEDNKAYQVFSVYAYKAELEEKNISPDKLDPKLQSLLRTCNFNDNPCIMLVTLK